MSRPKQVQLDDEGPSPFRGGAATFQRQDSRHGNGDLSDDMPSNLMNSKSNVPGMSAQELLAAHRRSLGELNGSKKGGDYTSLTLSRHQVEPEDIECGEALDAIPDQDYRDALESFHFGSSDE